MTVKMRGHHLLCSLTYQGKGYSPVFVQNYDRIMSRVNAGEEIEIVAGLDDVCQALVQEQREAHCLLERIGLRDAYALHYLKSVGDVTLQEGQHITMRPDLVKRLRSFFRSGAIRATCFDCEWHALCSEIADGNFEDTALRPTDFGQGEKQ
jgi:hypothetical protein